MLLGALFLPPRWQQPQTAARHNEHDREQNHGLSPVAGITARVPDPMRVAHVVNARFPRLYARKRRQQKRKAEDAERGTCAQPSQTEPEEENQRTDRHADANDRHKPDDDCINGACSQQNQSHLADG